MTSTTSAGTTIGITAAVPSSQDEAGFAALAFTTIGGIESIAAFGAQVAVNSFQPLNGPQNKHKGAVNYGSLQLPMAVNKADAGQMLLGVAAAPANRALYSFCVTFPNGDKRYFQGRAFGMQETVGSATNVLMATSTVEICTPVVKAEGDPIVTVPTPTVPATVNYVAEGDSITFGLAVGGTYAAYPTLAANGSRYSNKITTVDIATSGLTVTGDNGMNSRYASRTGAAFNAASALNVLSLMGGTNDNAVSNQYAVYRGLRSIIRKARTTGYQRVIIGTLISRNVAAFDTGDGSVDHNFDGNTLPLNLDIRQNWNGDLDADALMDFAAAPGLDTAAHFNATYTADGTHPNAQAYQVMKNVTGAALDAVIVAAGTRAPLAIWSPYDASLQAVLSNNNRTFAVGYGYGGIGTRSLVGKAAGKWYFELKLDNAQNVDIGIVGQDGEPALQSNNAYVAPRYAFNSTNGPFGFGTGDVIQVALDADKRLVWMRPNGTGLWNGNASADPVAGTGGIDVSGAGAGPLYAYVAVYTTPGQVTARFAAAQQGFAAPTGFNAIA